MKYLKSIILATVFITSCETPAKEPPPSLLPEPVEGLNVETGSHDFFLSEEEDD